MLDYFSPHYTGAPFDLFGPGHLAALVFVGAAVTWLLRTGLRADEAQRATMRRVFGASLILDELILTGWRLTHGTWELHQHLPLQMCGAMLYLTGFTFLFGFRRTYPFVYFFGIAGAIQGVLTPDAGAYGLPHYVAIETIFSHSALVTAGLWVAIVEGFRPRFQHFWMVFGTLNLAALVMFFVNRTLGSNYLYVNAKPPTASIVDLLPPWPTYILYLEAVAFGLFFLLYLPFAVGRMRTGDMVSLRVWNRQGPGSTSR